MKVPTMLRRVPEVACITYGHSRLATPREMWEATGMSSVCRRCGKGCGKSGRWDIPDGLERLVAWKGGSKA